MYFSVEVKSADQISEGKSEVEIYINKESLEDLLLQLSFLKEAGDHAHFMSPSWGAGELSENPYVKKNQAINHLKITLVD
ncbi:Imm32 family immunity protein [Alcanivorax sp. 24]|uniref:Imm32 family immunity protein n=1 Tax=Alcanivorax sp. 24 TaxID=2545266 RepID=UPI00105C03BC|nr:Imm32 family immunity protein [Alcanivorax sp. 24]